MKEKIILVGLPKCGTLSFNEYFSRLGYKSCHFLIDDCTLHIATVIQTNFENNVPLLSGKLEEYDAFTQMDACTHETCIFPQITMLEELTSQYANAKFILNSRDTAKHAKSIMTWCNYLERLSNFDMKHFPKKKTSFEDVQHWIESHNQDIRDFFRQRPCVQFMEINIEDIDIDVKLPQFLGRTTTIQFPKTNVTKEHD